MGRQEVTFNRVDQNGIVGELGAILKIATHKLGNSKE